MGANDIDMEEGTLEIGMGKPLITDHTLYSGPAYKKGTSGATAPDATPCPPYNNK